MSVSVDYFFVSFLVATTTDVVAVVVLLGVVGREETAIWLAINEHRVFTCATLG